MVTLRTDSIVEAVVNQKELGLGFEISFDENVLDKLKDKNNDDLTDIMAEIALINNDISILKLHKNSNKEIKNEILKNIRTQILLYEGYDEDEAEKLAKNIKIKAIYL